MGPVPSSSAVVAHGSRYRGFVGGFHFRTLVRAHALSVAMGHAVLRLGRAGAAVGVGDGRVPLVGPLPSSPAVVALGSRHRGVVGGFHFRTLAARARALSALGCHGRSRVEVVSGGRGSGGGRRTCPLSRTVPIFSRRRGARLTSSRCFRWFPFPYACARARPLGCHGRRHVEVGSGGRRGGAGQKPCPLSGAVPVFSRSCGARLTSS